MTARAEKFQAEIVQEAFALVVGDPNNTDFLARNGKLTAPDSYLFFVPLTGADVLTPTTTLPVSALESQAYVAIPRHTGVQALDEMLEQVTATYQEGNVPKTRMQLITIMDQAGWDSSVGEVDPTEAFFDITTTPEWHIPSTAKTPSYKPAKGLFSFSTPSAIHDEQRMYTSVRGAKNLPSYLEPIIIDSPAHEEPQLEDQSTKAIRKKEKSFKKGKHPKDALQGPKDKRRPNPEDVEDGEKSDGKKFVRSTVDKADLPDIAEVPLPSTDNRANRVKPTPTVVQSVNGQTMPVDNAPEAQQQVPALEQVTQLNEKASLVISPIGDHPEAPQVTSELTATEIPTDASTTITVIGEDITLTPITITKNGQKGTRYAIPTEMQDKYYGFVRLDPEEPDYEAGDIKSLLSPNEIATQTWALLPNTPELHKLLNFIYANKGENQEDRRYFLDQHLKEVLGKLNQGVNAPGVYSPESQPTSLDEAQLPAEYLSVHGTDIYLHKNEDGTFALPEGYVFVNAVTTRGMYNAGTILDQFITSEKAASGTYILVADTDGTIKSLKAKIDAINTERPTTQEGKKEKAKSLLSFKIQLTQKLESTLNQQGWEQIPWGSTETDDYGNLLGFCYVPKKGKMLKPGLYSAAIGAHPRANLQTEARSPFNKDTAYVRFFYSEEEAQDIYDRYPNDSFSIVPGRYNLGARETYGAYVVANTLESIQIYIEKVAQGAKLNLSDGTLELNTRQHFLLFETAKDQAFSRLEAVQHILARIAKKQQAKGKNVPDWVKAGKINCIVTNFRKPNAD